MKKKTKITILVNLGLLLTLIVIIGGLHLHTQSQKQKNENVQQYTEQYNKSLEFLNTTPFKEKNQSLYDYLDSIETSTRGTKTFKDYETIEELENQTVESIKELTKGKNTLIYFGFEECPYCGAFTPKLNWLSKELNINTYYINTRKLDRPVIDELKKIYHFSKVPTLVWVKTNGSFTVANNQTKMAELETFLNNYKEAKDKES